VYIAYVGLWQPEAWIKTCTHENKLMLFLELAYYFYTVKIPVNNFPHHMSRRLPLAALHLILDIAVGLR